jgi:exodeoxyribonuclease-3
MRVIAWNINSIKVRLEHLRELVKTADPDIVLLQEIKCETEKFPEDLISDLPYNFYISGQKTYNGVAILSKFRADEVNYNFDLNPLPDQARFLEITCNTPKGFYRVISLYAPNGGEVGSDKFHSKLKFYDALTSYLEKKKSIDEKMLIGGDFNIAPFDIDVYAPNELAGSTCFTLQERKKMRSLLNSGFFDIYRLLNPDKQDFSWWDYRAGAFEQNKGMRIDFILACASAVSDFNKCYIDYDSRAKDKPSDHAPIIISG